jgi:hypothetical protein
MAAKGITEPDVAEAIAGLMYAVIKKHNIRVIIKLRQGSLTTISCQKRTRIRSASHTSIE